MQNKRCFHHFVVENVVYSVVVAILRPKDVALAQVLFFRLFPAS